MSRPDRQAQLARKPEVAALEGRRLLTLSSTNVVNSVVANAISLAESRPTPAPVAQITTGSTVSHPAAATPISVSVSVSRLAASHPTSTTSAPTVIVSSSSSRSHGLTSPVGRAFATSTTAAPTANPVVITSAATSRARATHGFSTGATQSATPAAVVVVTKPRATPAPVASASPVTIATTAPVAPRSYSISVGK